MRIAHVSDSHIGYRALKKTRPDGRNARAQDVRDAFTKAIDGILAARVDLVIHAGDLFDNPRPDWGDVAHAIEQFNRLSDVYIPIFLIAGNHDTSTLRTKDNVFTVLDKSVDALVVASADEQRYYQSVDLAVGEDWRSVGPVNINLIASRKLKSEYPPTAIIDPNAVNIMVVHGIAGDIPDAKAVLPIGDEPVADYLLNANYDYIAMGDWHQTRQMRENAWYAGPTERFGWGDVNAKPGWLLVEVARGQRPTVTHQPIATRPMADLGDISAQGATPNDAFLLLRQALDDAHLTPDAMARVRFTEMTDRAWFHEMQRLVNKLNYPIWSLAMRWTLASADQPEQTLAAAMSREIPKLDVMELFAEYVASRPYAETSFGEAFIRKGVESLTIAAESVAQKAVVDE